MANPQDELDALKAQMAALAARIYVLEQRLGVSAPAKPQATVPPPVALSPTVKTEPPAPTLSPPQPPSVPSFATLSPSRSSRDQETSLEKRIGQYWLNRIGIVRRRK